MEKEINGNNGILGRQLYTQCIKGVCRLTEAMKQNHKPIAARIDAVTKPVFLLMNKYLFEHTLL